MFENKNDNFKYGGRSNNLVCVCGSSVCLSTPETRRTLMQMHTSNDGGSAVEPDPRMMVFRKQKLLWNGWCLYLWDLGYADFSNLRCHDNKWETATVFSSQGHRDDQQREDATQRAHAWGECKKLPPFLLVLVLTWPLWAIATTLALVFRKN